MDNHRRAHKWAFPLGVLLTALAVVGAVTLVRMLWGFAAQKFDKTAEKAMYEEFLATIILHDPDPFDSVGAVPDGKISQLLDISIWAILRRTDSSPVKLPEDDGDILISQEMVETEYEKIFGQKPSQHASIEGNDFDFAWDPGAKVYRIPVTGSLNIYLPRVTKINKTGSSIVLTVEYKAYNDFGLDESGRFLEPPEAAKTMLITLYEQADPDYPFRVGSISEPMGGEE